MKNIPPPINPLHTPAYNDGPGPACISQEALYSVLGDAMLNATHHFVPVHMENKPFAINAPLDVEEYANGVVHPITNETLTKYEQLISAPELREIWMRAMCKELGRLAQGYGDTEGTDTIHFMSLDEINKIPGDRTVTYAISASPC